jgi:hypothetical protein
VKLEAEGRPMEEQKAALLVSTSTDETNTSSEPTSKNQQKRLLKAQKIAETKSAKRQYEKEKKKARRLAARLAGEDLGKEKREANAREKHISPSRVVIDLSFESLMTTRVRVY